MFGKVNMHIYVITFKQTFIDLVTLRIPSDLRTLKISMHSLGYRVRTDIEN